MYLPSKSRYKIYIIDEVHMLSQSAFNALLKTLEEPPDNVVFMFATTEPDDIPQTIISRCQRFDLKPISEEKVIDSLKKICKSEKFTISDYSLGIIAREGRGSMRDSLSILDKLIAYGGNKIEENEIVEILGLVRREMLSRAVAGIIEKDAKSLLSVVDEIFSEGYDPKAFLSELIEYVRNLLVLKVDSKVKIPSVLDDEMNAMRAAAEKVTLEELQLIFDLLKDATIEIGRSDYQRFIIEMALIRASSVTPLASIDKVINDLEKNLKASNSSSSQANTQSTKPPIKKDSAPAKTSAHSGSETGQWHDILSAVKKKKPYLGVALSEGQPAMDRGKLKITFPKGSFHYEKVSEPESLEFIRKVAMQTVDKPPMIEIVAGPKQPGQKVSDTGANQKKASTHEETKSSDNAVEKALNILGGRIDGENLKT